MAVEMFMRLDGVKGGSRNYHHQGWSDLLSWSWDLERIREGAQAGVTNMNEISVVKAIGIDSAALMNLFAEGAAIASAEISAVPVVGKREARQKYVSIALEDVRIQAISTDGTTDESFFKEHVTLSFGKVRFEFSQNSEAAATPGPATATSYAFGWDLAANTAIPCSADAGEAKA